MDIIKRWLNGNQNFMVGRLYYKQFGKDKNLQQLFDKGETAFAKQKLVEALTALLTEEKKEPVKTPEPLRVGVMPKSDDAIAAAIEVEWRQHYQRMNFLRHKLDEFGDSNTAEAVEVRKKYAFEILELDKKCNACWEKLDYYKLHKQVPEVKADEEFVIPTDAIELATLIQTLKRNIRRNKQKAKDNPGNAIYPALVKKYETHLQLINKKK